MVEDTGCDGVELNFGCPHGMSERGMGSAVGQVPEYIEDGDAAGCKNYSTPAGDREAHAEHHRHPARRRAAANRGGADAVSLINTINSIMGVDLDALVADAERRRQAARTAAIAARRSSRSRSTWSRRSRASPRCAGMPISGIGGISNWRDAAEFIALGAGNVQVCTAAMLYGFKIVEDMIDGLAQLDGRQGL